MIFLFPFFSISGFWFFKIFDNISPFWQWFNNSKKSELLIVFGEDSAAILGLLMALVAIILTMITKNPVYDAIGSMFIGGLLVIIAVVVGKQIMTLLIGSGVEDYKEKEYIDFYESFQTLDKVLNIKTLQLGNDVMVAVKVKMIEFSNCNDMINAINHIEKELKNKFPEIKWSFFEPDNTDNND